MNIIKFIKKLFSREIDVIISRYSRHDYLITIFYSDGREEHFLGDCTVWYEYYTGKRCSTLKESYLHGIWESRK